MGAAAYNRGSRIASREADARMPVATARADQQAHADEVTRLREQVVALERELRRKDKALAETAALLVLSKKVAAIFNKGEDE